MKRENSVCGNMKRRILTFIAIFIILSVQAGLVKTEDSTTQLSLNPDVIQIPLADLGETNFAVIAVRLNVSNVNRLKSFSLNFAYDMYVIEYLGFGKMDEWFYNTVGGWTGWYTQGELSKTFSGSATMFAYYFKVLHSGSTQIRLTDTRLWDESGNAIPHSVSGCTINVLTFEEWIDGEYVELSMKYDILLADYASIQSDYDDYRATHSYTNLEFDDILSQKDQYIDAYDSLVSEYNSLNATYSQYKQTHSYTDDEYDHLILENQRLTNELGRSSSLNYILIAVSVILLALTAYYARKKS